MRLAPYDEFFADLFAVLVTKNGSAMYSSFAIRVKDRDFTSNGMDTSVEEIKKNKLYRKDDHNYFFKIRQFLWDKFEKSGMTEKTAKEILQKAYLAIGASTKNRLKKYPTSMSSRTLTPEQLTFVEEDLLEEIKKVF